MAALDIVLMRQRPRNYRLYTLLAVCGFLLLAVGLVFGQTLRHEFVNWTTTNISTRTRTSLDGSDSRRHSLGLHEQPTRPIGIR